MSNELKHLSCLHHFCLKHLPETIVCNTCPEIHACNTFFPEILACNTFVKHLPAILSWNTCLQYFLKYWPTIFFWNTCLQYFPEKHAWNTFLKYLPEIFSSNICLLYFSEILVCNTCPKHLPAILAWNNNLKFYDCEEFWVSFYHTSYKNLFCAIKHKNLI